MTLTVYDLAPTVARAPCEPPSARPGTVALLNTIDRRHPDGTSLGIFNCRLIRGSSSAISKHADSEALDWRPGVEVGSAAFVAEGDRIAAALVAAAVYLGVQRIIWNGRMWTAARGWRDYTGPAGPHRDHLHIELTRAAALTLTMAAIAAAFGTRPPRKADADMPNPTDIVSACAVAAKGGGAAVHKLERQGGILTEGRPVAFHGSMLSRGMAEHTARSSRNFVAIVTTDFAKGEYAVIDSAGHVYGFTAELGRQLDAVGGK